MVTESVASSKASQTSQQRGKFTSIFFAQTFPLFPYFVLLDFDINHFISICNVILTFLQFSAMVINPRIPHGETLAAVDKIVYFFILPIWDKLFSPDTPPTAYHVLFFIAISLPILVVIISVASVLLYRTSITRRVFNSFVGTLIRVLVHSISTTLFMPLVHSYMSMLICKVYISQASTDAYLAGSASSMSQGIPSSTDGTVQSGTSGIAEGVASTLWTQDTVQCGSPLQQGAKAIAIFDIIILCVMATLCQTCIFPREVTSNCFNARAHGYIDTLLVLVKVGTVILFHVLLSLNLPHVFVGILLLAMIIMLVAYATVLPYFNHNATRLYCIGATFTAFLCVLSLISIVGATGGYSSAVTYNRFNAGGSMKPGESDGYLSGLFGSATGGSDDDFSLPLAISFIQFDIEALLLICLCLPVIFLGRFFADIRINREMLIQLPRLLDTEALTTWSLTGGLAGAVSRRVRRKLAKSKQDMYKQQQSDDDDDDDEAPIDITKSSTAQQPATKGQKTATLSAAAQQQQLRAQHKRRDTLRRSIILKKDMTAALASSLQHASSSGHVVPPTSTTTGGGASAAAPQPKTPATVSHVSGVGRVTPQQNLGSSIVDQFGARGFFFEDESVNTRFSSSRNNPNNPIGGERDFDSQEFSESHGISVGGSTISGMWGRALGNGDIASTDRSKLDPFTTPEISLLYPRGLPPNDLAVTGHVDICNDIFEKVSEDYADSRWKAVSARQAQTGKNSVANKSASIGRGGSMTGSFAILEFDGQMPEILENVTLLSPYLRSVILPTDIEVSTRFLRVYKRVTRGWPKPEMILLASRIFTKGMTKYWEDGNLFCDFAYFVSSYTGKASLALSQLERAQKYPSSLPAKYRAFRLHSRLKAELNLRDADYQKMCDQSKKMHKEMLIHFQTFWSKLIPEYVDMSQLSAVATLINSRRSEGKAVFLHALAHGNNDRQHLVRYASYVDQVMLEADQAEQLRLLNKQEAEERKMKVMRGAKGTLGFGSTSYAVAIAEMLAQHEHNEADTTPSTRRHQNYVWLFIGILFLATGGFLAVLGIHYKAREHSLRCALDAGISRGLVSQGATLAVEHQLGIPVTNPTLRLEAVQAIATDLASVHNRLIYSDERVALGTYSHEPTMVVQRILAPGISKFVLVSHLDVGYNAIAQLRASVDLASITTAGATALSIIANQKQVLYESFRDAYYTWYGAALDRVAQECLQQQGREAESFIVTMSVLFALVIACFIGLAISLALHASHTYQFKYAVLSLFPTIPRKALRMMYNRASERVQLFDAQEEDKLPEADMSELSTSAGGGAALGRGDRRSSLNSNPGNDFDQSVNADNNINASSGGVGGALDSGSSSSPLLLSSSSGVDSNNIAQRPSSPSSASRDLSKMSLTELAGAEEDDDRMMVETRQLLGSSSRRGGDEMLSNRRSPGGIVGLLRYFPCFKSRRRRAQNGSNDLDDDEEEDNVASPLSAIQVACLVSSVLLSVALVIVCIVITVIMVSSVKSMSEAVDAVETQFVDYQRLENYQRNVELYAQSYDVDAQANGDRYSHQLITSMSTVNSRVEAPDLVLNTISLTVTAIKRIGEQFTLAAEKGQVGQTQLTVSRNTSSVVPIPSLAEQSSEYYKNVAIFSVDEPTAHAKRDASVAMDRLTQKAIDIAADTRSNSAGALAFSALLIWIVLILVMAFTYVNAGPSMYTIFNPFSMLLNAVAFAFYVLSLVAILVAILAFNDQTAVQETIIKDLQGRNASAIELTILPRTARRFSFVGDTRSFLTYNDRRTFFPNTEALAFLPAGSAARASYNENIAEMLKLEEIAIRLTLSYFPSDSMVALFNNNNDNATSSSSSSNNNDDFTSAYQLNESAYAYLGSSGITDDAFAVYGGTTWDFYSDPNEEGIRTAHPNEHLWYSDSYTDLRQSAWWQVSLARRILFSDRYRSLLLGTEKALLGAIDDIIASDHVEFNKKGDIAQLMSIIASVAVGIATVLMLFAMGVGVREQVLSLSRSGRANSASEASSDINDRHSLTYSGELIAKVSAVIILGLFVGLLVVGFLDKQSSADISNAIDDATARQWLVAKSMTIANQFDDGKLTNESASFELQDLTSQMSKRQQALVQSDFIISDANHRSFLFDRDQTIDGAFACIFTPNGSYTPKSLLVGGAVVTFESWQQLVQDLSSANTEQRRTRAIAEMRAAYAPTIQIMRQSTNYLSDSIDSYIQQNTVIFAILASILLAALLVMSVWGIRPLLIAHAQDLVGSKLLIRLIPQNIKEEVPAIQEFIESEIGVDGAGEDGGNSSSKNDDFDGSKRSGGLSAEKAAEAASVAVIAIDSKGVVLKFNSASELMFGYTAAEVVGNNVKMLMPDKVAEKHNFYLARYRATGIQRVIGYDRHVRAKHRSGMHFPVEITIKEYERDNGDLIFFGFLKVITKQLEMKAADELNNIILDNATVPMIAIDALGTVIRFNRAAEACFGQGASDVINQNVKMLMPEEIAVRHDAYLASYLRTGERHVIDRTRRTAGLRKNGDIFLMDLTVKEITINSDISSMSTFLGFVRDASRDVLVENAKKINEDIANLSPTPIVGTDAVGKVLKFNQAAVDLWGYDAGDVVGQNVKILMPEDVAELHDSYLENYKRTGLRKAIGRERLIVGKKLNGTLMPLRSIIKEERKNDQIIYIGYFQDMSDVRKATSYKAVDDLIIDSHPVPLLTMSDAGVILRVNRSLCQEFGFRREELIGSNVKMLMPPHFANNHDSYLSRYRRTKVRKVVGSKRRVEGMRKSRETFPIEIAIEEIVDAERRSTFIGFLRNLCNEIALEQHYKINKACLAISPIPVIVTNRRGMIVSFSKAAEDLFKRSASEVMLKNVTILMPAHISAHHDYFLRRYRQTGVKHFVDAVSITEGQDKFGKVFPIEISIKDVKKVSSVASIAEQLRRINVSSRGHNDAAGGIGGGATAAPIASTSRELEEELAIGLVDRLKRTGGRNADDSGTEDDEQEGLFVGSLRDISRDGEAQETIQRNEGISELSPTPLVQIDVYGSVTHYNRAAEEEFQWTKEEIIGRNIRILLPDEIARNHDQYLANYRKTRVRSIVGNLRRTRAKRKDGKLFAVEIFINEIIVENDSDRNSYVGYIRNVTEELRLLKANQVSGVVSDLSPIPLVAISSKGTVVAFNKAACDAFRYTDSSQVLTKNVKILMPDEVGAKHDGYLVAYRKTKEKKVIDSTRFMTARRSDGSHFKAEISVREIVRDGQESTFLSYIRDCTEDLEITHANQIMDVVQSLSTIPLIVIDDRGTVKRVNEATLKLFKIVNGERDIVGHNVRELCPPKIAARHDGYLKRYLETGEKHVVDRARTVIAKKFDGTLFHAELSVRELRVDATVAPQSKNGSEHSGSHQGSEIGEGSGHTNTNTNGEASHHSSEGAALTTTEDAPDSDYLTSAKITMFIGYIRDVEMRRELENNLYLNEALAQGSAVPMVGIDPKGRIITFSPAAQVFFQYSREEIIGKNVKLLMTSAVAKKHDQYLLNYLKTGKKAVLDSTRLVQAKKRSGMVVPVSLTVREVPSKTMSSQTNYIGYIVDQSKEHAEDLALCTANAVRDLLPAAIITITSYGIVREFSRAAEAFFGYAREEVIGHNVKMLMPAEISVQHDAYLENYRQTLVRHVVGSRRNVKGMHRDGSALNIDLQVSEFIVNRQRMFVGFLNNRQERLDLQQANSITSAMISLSLLPMVAINSRKLITRFNPAAEEEFGYSASEILGQNVKILMPDRIGRMHDSYIDRYHNTGVPRILNVTIEVMARRKNGEEFCSEITVREISKTGHSPYFVAYVRDITVEKSNRSTKILSNAISTLMPDPFIAIKPDGGIVMFTQAAARLFQYHPTEVLGRNVNMLMQDDLASQHDSFLKRYMDTATVDHRILDVSRKVIGKKKNGDPVELELRIIEKVFEGKSYLLGYVRDCTQDLDLALQGEVGELLVETNPDAIIVISMQCKILKFNAIAEKLFHFDREHVLGRNVKVLMPDGIARRHDQFVSNYLRTGIKRVIDSVREVTAEKKNGETFQAQLSVRRVDDETGNPHVFIGFLREIDSTNAALGGVIPTAERYQDDDDIHDHHDAGQPPYHSHNHYMDDRHQYAEVEDPLHDPLRDNVSDIGLGHSVSYPGSDMMRTPPEQRSQPHPPSIPAQ